MPEASPENNSVRETTLVDLEVNRLIGHDFYRLSSFARISSLGNKLYIPVSFAQQDTLLFAFDVASSAMRGIVRSGRGPGELTRLNATSRDQDGIIHILDMATTTILSISNNLTARTKHIPGLLLPVAGNEFVISDHIMATGISMINVSDGYLIGFYDMQNETLRYHVKARIPAGFEPASRNIITAMAPVPGGFVFAFAGDKSLQFIDFEGKYRTVARFGDDDPIPAPYPASSFQPGPGAQPYIPKIELLHNDLFVICNGTVYRLDASSFEILENWIFRDSATSEEIRPIMDFTITDQIVAVRGFPNELFYATRQPTQLP